MSRPPSGTVTFLFTDIEGSTQLWERFPEAMREALVRHDGILRESIGSRGGYVFKTVGDAFCAAFEGAAEALHAALEAQHGLHAEAWGETGPIRVRMALHTGGAVERDDDYYGPTVNRVARLLSLAYGGQVLLSRTAREVVGHPLPGGADLRDLGLHRLKDLQQPEHVFQILHPALPAEFPPLKSLDHLPTNLPVQLTSFVGRDREMAEVRRLLKGTRLLTLTGAGGCGKTRLAVETGADLLEEYPDGVWLVELAPLSDPSFVPQAVATALGVREQPHRPVLATVTDYLQAKKALLILDNCEHLVAACAQVAEALLRSCPRLQVLATSREILNVSGETSWRVPSLSLPECWAPDGSEQPALQEYESVRLFTDRAAAVRPEFRLTPENAPAVAQVCCRLDGIPLALELAAARVKALSVEQIAARLDDSFRLLTGGSRTALPRQQTLRALVDWSYDLLTESERALLRRLSVFSGGWTLEAAEAVCGCMGVWVHGCGTEPEAASSPTHPHTHTPIHEHEVLDLLTSLVDKSLVLAEDQDGEVRYRMLETIRQYGRMRLDETGEAEAVRARHRAFFLELAERAEPEILGPRQAEWLDRLEGEHANLRAALEWSMETGAEAGQLAGTLWRFWVVRGYFSEAQERLSAVLARMDASETDQGRSKTVTGMGVVTYFRGDYARAAELCGRSLALARALGDKWSAGVSLVILGTYRQYYLGDGAQAHALFQESLALAREVGDRWLASLALGELGLQALYQGDGAKAAELCAESLSLARQVGNTWLLGVTLGNTGTVALQCGDVERAISLLRESLMIRSELGDKLGICVCLGGLAGVAGALGQAERSGRLFGATEALLDLIGGSLPPAFRVGYERVLEGARQQMDQASLAEAWAAGRKMPLDEAIAEALEG